MDENTKYDILNRNYEASLEPDDDDPSWDKALDAAIDDFIEHMEFDIMLTRQQGKREDVVEGVTANNLTFVTADILRNDPMLRDQVEQYFRANPEIVEQYLETD